MVRFGWPVKTTKSVPPPETSTYTPPRYQEERHASAVPFPSTITSNTQTTHFLSLPISRKLQEQRADPSRRLSMHDTRPYQAGLDHSRTQGTSSPREKSLPPTPSSSNEDVRVNHIPRTESSISIENQSFPHRPSNRFPLPTTTTASPPTRPSPSQAKIALAQAALAIGLPHGMPQASASSSRSDVTSTTFLAIPQPPVPSSGLRRAKSLHQLSRTFRRDDNDNTRASPERPRRSRRTSFGPANALDSEENGDRTTVEGIPSHITPPRKSLVKKASFWNRRHNDLLKPTLALPPEDPPRNSFDRLSHVLPSLPPLTPLRFDTSILCSSSHSSQTEGHLPPSPPGLNRRSESRNRPLSPSLAASSPDLSVQTLRTQSPGRRRPLTAGSAADRSRALSYVHPPDHSSPLAPAPTPPQNPDVAAPRRTARPRSQTNPATLLHRLSANIFSFSSSTLSPPTSGTNRVHTNDSPRESPRTSTSKLPPPKPRPDEESPVAYVDRLLGTIGKADVASVLASRYDPFMYEIASSS